MGKLEGGRVVHRANLAAHRFGDLAAAMAQATAPQARQTVQHLAALVVGVISTLGADHHARTTRSRGFEIAVAGVGHPMGLHPRRVAEERAGTDDCSGRRSFVEVHGGPF